MYVVGDTVVTSASDITGAAACEFAFLRKVDAKLGRDVVVPELVDEMVQRAAELGDTHELRQLDHYRTEYGAQAVVEINKAQPRDFDDLESKAAATLEALRSDARVVFQATFFDRAQRSPVTSDEPTIAFVGYADFLYQPEGLLPATWQVQDTKLARHAKVAALLQLAAYGEQLERVNVAVNPKATLILGDRSRSLHSLADIAPLFRSRRARMIELILDSWARTGSDGQRQSATPVQWGAPGVSACGRCEVCEPEVLLARDPLLIGGVSVHQRSRLLAAGFDTIDAVATMRESVIAGSAKVAGISQPALQKLTAQASIQLREGEGSAPAFEVVDASMLAALPPPNPGDIFFDFEGDPLYQEVSAQGRQEWGLDYLFGFVTNDEQFTAFWAHNLEEERQALIRFIEYVAQRRKQYPNLHIYHYAPYERSHLLSIAARNGVCENEVDDLLREQVLVDLYPIVKKSVLVGSPSYSIKKLEPLYMGDDRRDEDGVTTGAASVTAYAVASELLRSDEPVARAEGQETLDNIAEYNEYDCVSTLRLRDWLLSLATEHNIVSALHTGEEVAEDEEPDATSLELSALAADLMRGAEDYAAHGLQAERDVCALAASAIDYHRREQKSYWWEHYNRLTAPIEEWADTKDVFVCDGRSVVEEGWHKPPRARTLQRVTRLFGSFAPGSTVRPSSTVFALFDEPVNDEQANWVRGELVPMRLTVEEIDDGSVTVREKVKPDADQHSIVPVALTPGPPPPPLSQKPAIAEWGASIAAALASARDAEGVFDPAQCQLPQDPVVDLLLRAPARFTSHTHPVAVDSAEALQIGETEDHKTIGAVVASLLDLEQSYIAVQGPPGTGKTYLAARVIRTLVEQHGWHIGVVAQSHKVVENVLEGVVSAGLDPKQVGKAPQQKNQQDTNSEATPSYTVVIKNKVADFVHHLRAAGKGSVVGGTAWDFSNPDRFDRRSLDLLVVDEAGQFSLAPTIASAVAAERLLLLGDPQQLPQVSQGTHPEPVDTSALGWLLDDHETLPEELGYFLAESRRMQPLLCDVVSELSYEKKLSSHPSTAQLQVTGAGEAGLRWHPVKHEGNTTSSIEEAAEVVRVAQESLGASVTLNGETKKLTQDNIIVVAPYNAQVECVHSALSQAGLDEIRVGTVDKFQGQEAVIAIVTLAASNANDIPRGIEFLLMPNRLNVAISRAQWLAHLISSEHLGGTGLPPSPQQVPVLSGYLRLVERGRKAKDEALP